MKSTIQALMILSVLMVGSAEARTDMPFVDNEMKYYDELPKYADRRGGGHWHRYRNPAYRGAGYFWGYSALSRWRGDYYWKNIGYVCEGGSCYKRLCLFQTGAVVPVRCETRKWTIW